MSTLLNLRLRRVRDFLLALDLWDHVQIPQELNDAELALLEITLAKLEALQAKTWDCVSCKLITQAYCKEDDFWTDCSPYLQAVSEVPQLKRLHYESMVLSKQIMMERLVPTHGVGNKVAQAQAQLQHGAHYKTAASQASDANLSRLFSVAAQALVANKDAGALLECCQLECGTHTILDTDVRRIISLLQKHGGKGGAGSSSKRGEWPAGRRGEDSQAEIGNENGSFASAVGFLSLSASTRGEGGALDEKRSVSGSRPAAGCGGPPSVLVGVTRDGSEVLPGETRHGPYLAFVTVWGIIVALGEFDTAVSAAQAHDRACLRAVGPQHCAAAQLNFPVESYSRDSMALLTAHDEALRRELQWGSQWRGLQDCDFAFVISQTKRGCRQARSTGGSNIPSPNKAKPSGSTDKTASSSIAPSDDAREASPNKKRKREGAGRDDSWAPGGCVPSTELVNYALPDLSAWFPASNIGERDRRRNTLRSRGYWKFDGASAAESARCGEVPPLNCYILAQEVLRSKVALSTFTSCQAPEPEEVMWEVYERPYAPREQESLFASRNGGSSGQPHVVPPVWERCLARSAAALRDLAAFRADVQQSLLVVEERQARMQIKRGYQAGKRSILTGVRQLSSKHSVYICTLPENVMDPLSRLSTNQDVEFGCFTYALEAAMVREQINNHGSKARRSSSNFSSEEWDAIRALSSQLAVLLKAHKLKY